VQQAEAAFTLERPGKAASMAIDAEQFDSAVSAWRRSPTTGHWGDVLSFAVDPALHPALQALAEEAAKDGKLFTSGQRALMRGMLGVEALDDRASVRAVGGEDAGSEIRALREVLRDTPTSALTWLDLAQFDLACGKPERALRKLTAARALSPDSRISLRTMARFFVHQGQEERAHQLVARHRRTPSDPWLMASEIALAGVAKRASRFANQGLRLIKEQGARPQDLSELAGALGGLDLESGHLKRARDLFRIALQRPNDNVVAQTFTDRNRLGIELAGPAQVQVAGSAAEVQTLIQWEQRDTVLAEASALKWHREEPFSSRPIQFLTTLYAIQEKYVEGIAFARRGLLADPRDVSLLTNLAYLMASAGQLDRSEELLRRSIPSRDARYEGVVLATHGLIAMHRGAFELGDALYQEAALQLDRHVDMATGATCRAYHARSAAATSNPKRTHWLQVASGAYAHAPSAEADIILTRLGLTSDPLLLDKAMRRTVQWIFDEQTQSLIKRDAVTPVGAPSLLIKPKAG
jgi:Flp pilus assembly protein TadD